jgi:hypothetical protein
VIFSIKIDEFEVLQIEGLYDMMNNKTNTSYAEMIVMSNGIASRPIV